MFFNTFLKAEHHGSLSLKSLPEGTVTYPSLPNVIEIIEAIRTVIANCTHTEPKHELDLAKEHDKQALTAY